MPDIARVSTATGRRLLGVRLIDQQETRFVSLLCLSSSRVMKRVMVRCLQRLKYNVIKTEPGCEPICVSPVVLARSPHLDSQT